MATQPLETIPEETTAPAQQATTPARVTAENKARNGKKPWPRGFWKTTCRTQSPGP